MRIRIAINGYGRIGRCVVRALYTQPFREFFELVAINELAPAATVSYLSRYDTVHGRFPLTVTQEKQQLQIDGDRIALLTEPEPMRLPWRELAIDVVLECSGKFLDLDSLQAHIQAGATAVLLSHPGDKRLPAVVRGVNDALLATAPRIVSCASCTSNAAAPVLHCIHRHFGVESGLITTVHAAMNDQPTLDSFNASTPRLNRAASASVIPVDTGLAQGIGRILPDLRDRFAAIALRVPTLNVSALDLCLHLRDAADAAAVNQVLRDAAQNDLSGILDCVEQPLVSSDFNHDPHSAIVDTQLTRCTGHLLKLFVWFDNEWSYANRMLELARQMATACAGGTRI